MRRNVLFGVLLVVFIIVILPVFGQAESIQNFITTINIEKSGSLQVTETIEYNFGSEQRHGIFRNISRASENGPLIQVRVVSVLDEYGTSYRFTESQSGNTLQIKIGDPAQFVTGIKTYIINYRVENVIRAFDDHEELYWNVTGNEWDVSISSAESFIVTPVDRNIELQMTCYTGAYGSKDQNCTYKNNDGVRYFGTTKALQSSEGLTIVLGMPVGTVDVTATGTSVMNSESFFKSGVVLLFFLLPVLCWGFIVFSIVMTIVKMAKRKPKPIIPRALKKKPIVVEYNPPEGLLPIEVGTIIDRRVDLTDISSVIVHLAVRGYLKIKHLDKIISFIPKRKDFELIKIKDGSDLTHPADVAVYDLLFRRRDSVRLSDLEKTKYTTTEFIEETTKSTEKRLVEGGYFDEQKKKNYIKNFVIGFIMFVVAIVIINIVSSGLRVESIMQSIFIILSILIFFLSFVMRSIRMVFRNKLTDRGIGTLEKILGFYEFLKLTEKDKLKLTNAPELQPELFEKFLPYAMVLGVEEQWAKRFENIYTAMPSWYADTSLSTFNSHALVVSLYGLNSSINSSIGASSGSHSSGFSGGGGGGFSGGGSGGGGGGSW